MSSPPDKTIPASDAAGRLLFHRPDLAARKKQRRMARELSEWTGHSRSAADTLAGCLAALPDCTVAELVDRLAADVEAGIRAAGPEDQERVTQPSYRVEAALKLGWSLLATGRQKTLLHLLALAEGGPLSPALLCQAAAASRGELDQVVASGFCSADAADYVSATPAVVAFVNSQLLPTESRELLVFGLIYAVRAALLNTDNEVDGSLELAYQLSWGLCSGALAPDLRASLTHRWVDLLRLRGDIASARREVERTLTSMQAAELSCQVGLESLLLLDRAILRIEAGEVVPGFEELEAVISRLQQAVDESPGTAAVLRRATLLKTQAEATFMRTPGTMDRVRELSDSRLAGDDAPASAPSEARETTERPGEAAALAQFEGLLLLRGGSLEDAQARLTEARSLAGGAGETGRISRAAIAISLAQVHAASEQAAEADALLEEARVESGGNLDQPLLVTLPLVLHELGIVAARAHRLAAAGTYLDEAAMMAASTLPSGHPTRLHITYSRGIAYLAGKDLSQAAGQFGKVVQRADPKIPAQQHVALLARSAQALVRYLAGKGEDGLADGELRDVRDRLAASQPDEKQLLEELDRIQRHYA